MHYLGLAFYGEGSSDYQFLRPLLQRVCEDVCIERAAGLVDVSEVIPLDHPAELAGEPRHSRIEGAARQHEGAWRLLFVHGDGSGDADLARQNLVQPALDVISAEFAGCVGVGVVPVRETEAWAICDGDALRQVFGVTLSDAELGIPASAREIEGNADPKATLASAFLRTNPAPQRRKQGVGSTLNALGDAVSLERLRSLPSFRGLEEELVSALHGLGILR